MSNRFSQCTLRVNFLIFCCAVFPHVSHLRNIIHSRFLRAGSERRGADDTAARALRLTRAAGRLGISLQLFRRQSPPSHWHESESSAAAAAAGGGGHGPGPGAESDSGPAESSAAPGSTVVGAGGAAAAVARIVTAIVTRDWHWHHDHD
jgi:hypothetical protein